MTSVPKTGTLDNLPASFKIIAQFALRQKPTEKEERAAKAGQDSAAGSLHHGIRAATN